MDNIVVTENKERGIKHAECVCVFVCVLPLLLSSSLSILSGPLCWGLDGEL